MVFRGAESKRMTIVTSTPIEGNPLSENNGLTIVRIAGWLLYRNMKKFQATNKKHSAFSRGQVGDETRREFNSFSRRSTFGTEPHCPVSAEMVI